LNNLDKNNHLLVFLSRNKLLANFPKNSMFYYPIVKIICLIKYKKTLKSVLRIIMKVRIVFKH